MQDSLTSPWSFATAPVGARGLTPSWFCGWAAVSPFRRASGGNGCCFHLRTAHPHWRTSIQPVKCPLSKSVKYLKTSEQEWSCYLRCSVRFAEGMDYCYLFNQTLRLLYIILVAHLLLSPSSFLFLKQLQWCPKWQMDQIVRDFAYLISMKDDSFLTTLRLLYSYSSHQL